MWWRWRYWQALRPVGRIGLFAVFLGLAMLSTGGERGDNRFSVVGAVITFAGVATALLNRRESREK